MDEAEKLGNEDFPAPFQKRIKYGAFWIPFFNGMGINSPVYLSFTGSGAKEKLVLPLSKDGFAGVVKKYGKQIVQRSTTLISG